MKAQERMSRSGQFQQDNIKINPILKEEYFVNNQEGILDLEFEVIEL